MAQNRLSGFFHDAKTLGVCEAPTDLRITQKPRKEVERKKKRASPKVNNASATKKRTAEDDLLANDFKKRKLMESYEDWSDSYVEPFKNRKRKPTTEEELIDQWDPQPAKRSRFTCLLCYQSFPDIFTLELHQSFDCQHSDDSSGSERCSDDIF